MSVELGVEVGGVVEGAFDASRGNLEGPASAGGEGIAHNSLSASFCFGSCRNGRPQCMLRSTPKGSGLILSAVLPHLEAAESDVEAVPRVDM